MRQLPIDILSGLPYGCVYGLLALGLVMGYRTSGVLNLALGAQGFLVALFFNAAIDAGWSPLVSFVVWVIVFGPFVGIALDRLLFRHVRGAPVVVQLVSVLGLLIAIPSLASVLAGSTSPSPHALILAPSSVYAHLGGYAISGQAIVTVSITAVVLALLSYLMHFSKLGLYMRLVVESPKLAELSGIEAERVGALAWGLSSLLAGLAGVLIVPILHQVSSFSLTTLVVAATAAAAVGGLTSLPLTMTGALLLGITQQIIAGFAPTSAQWTQGLRPSLPFVILGLALIFHPRLTHLAGRSDPMAGINPPVPSLDVVRRQVRKGRNSRWVVGLGATFAIAVVALNVTDAWAFYLSQGASYACIFLSITLLNGTGGQISLSQASFAGIGGFVTAQLAIHFALPVGAGVFAGALGAGIAGFIVAIPSSRLEGLGTALVTLAFAMLADSLLFPLSWMGNGGTGVILPRPQFGSISFNSSRLLLLFVLVFLAGLSWFVVWIRESRLGLEALAVSSSRRGAKAVGLSDKRVSISIFTLSAAIAGLGGGIFAITDQSISPNDFNSQYSFVFLVPGMGLGSRTVYGALVGGFGYVIVKQLLSTFAPQSFGILVPLVVGVLAISWVLHPEGIIERQHRYMAQLKSFFPKKGLVAASK